MSSTSEDEEYCETIPHFVLENITNGLVLSNTYLPEEILHNILIFVNWKDLMSFRLVCRSWKRIIDSVVCFEKLKRFSFEALRKSFTGPLAKLRTDGVPFYLYYAMSNGAFGSNLLKNGFGSGNEPHECRVDRDFWRNFQFGNRRDGQFINANLCSDRDCPRYKHWGLLKSGGNGWAVELEPVGSEALPSHLPDRSCYVTSYHWCTKEQLITLAEHGLTAKIMDETQPQFDISEWYARRWDCGIRYKLQVYLLDHEKQVIEEYEEETGEDLVDNSWHEVSHSFKNYGPGVRYVLFRHGGRDSQFWAGRYGAKIAGGSVIARIPSSLFEQSEDSDCKC